MWSSIGTKPFCCRSSAALCRTGVQVDDAPGVRVEAIQCTDLHLTRVGSNSRLVLCGTPGTQGSKNNPIDGGRSTRMVTLLCGGSRSFRKKQFCG